MILVPEKMTAGIGQEPNLEKQIRKQMGCMAGFFQIFDRHQILTGKRLCSPNGLHSGPLCDSTRETLGSVGSPAAMSSELEKSPQVRSMPSPDLFKKWEVRSPAPEPEPVTPSRNESKTSLPLPVFDFKEGTRSSWKFSKEAPRLSLDSRAVVDAKGSLKPRESHTNASILSPITAANDDDGDKQRRSPSVIARLMGLEAMMASEPEPEKKVELRRSASESRVSRDLFQNRFIDGVNLQVKKSSNPPMNSYNNVVSEERLKHDSTMKNNSFDPREYNARTARAEPAKVHQRGIGQRKCFYDSADFFPEPKQTVSVYNEIEKRLKQRGIDEPSKDLETLRHILEALQLKGLLHTNNKQYSSPANNRNFVYEQSYFHPSEESPIVLMKPGRRLSADFAENYRSEPGGGRRNPNFCDDLVSPRQRRGRTEIERNQTRGRSSVSPVRSEIGAKSPNRRRLWSVENRRENDLSEQRRVSPIQSPRFASKRNGPDPATTRSPRMKNPTVEIKRRVEKVLVPAEDESSVSGCSLISTNSQMDAERWRGDENRGGKNLLERCDKLLQSIAEMSTAAELQPSPVSVLDSSFCKEESSPSPVMKRSIDFKEVPFEWEDHDVWSPLALESESDDCDFLYICDVLRATNHMSHDSHLFLFLEKQQYLKGQDASNISMLHRKLIFDTIHEILTRKRQLPPWKAVSCAGQTCLQQVWWEFQQVKERDEGSEDLVQVICGVLRKDLAGDSVTGWADCPTEMSEAVLDMERLIFKDLIVETIRDLASVSIKCSSNRVQVVSRRKLVF